MGFLVTGPKDSRIPTLLNIGHQYVIDKKRDGIKSRTSKLEEQRRELQAKARLLAERRELPKLLNRVVPIFAKGKFDPRDVRTIFDSVEFVAFEGLNSDDGVQRVTLLHLGTNGALARSIEQTVARKSVGWNTIRIKDDGAIEQKLTQARA